MNGNIPVAHAPSDIAVPAAAQAANRKARRETRVAVWIMRILLVWAGLAGLVARARRRPRCAVILAHAAGRTQFAPGSARGLRLWPRRGLRLETREPDDRRLTRVPAHLRLRLQPGAARRPQRRAENHAAQILAELNAAHAGRLAFRHARYRTRNGRRDTARATTGTARRNIGGKNGTHIGFLKLSRIASRRGNERRERPDALCHRPHATFLHNRMH